MADLSQPAAAPDRLTIRPATGADIAAIVVLMADDVLGRAREDVSPAAFRAYAEAFERVEAQPGNQVWVAERGGATVATMQTVLIPGLSHQGATRLEIEALIVGAPHRGQGIGAALVAFALEEARRNGARIVQLTSSAGRAEARRFYERMGFTATHTGFKRHLD
jgi:GNAT superfamily N-acetyltransferase